MKKQIKKLRVNKETINLLATELLEGVVGGDTYTLCTLYNCGWTYRNCPSSPQHTCDES